jgi:hypothetical protein
MRPRFTLLLATLAALAAGPLRADTVAGWVAKARAYLGSESALNGVVSIHITGKLETTEGNPKTHTPEAVPTVTRSADIIFQKPYRQLITLSDAKLIETHALDDYEGWLKRANALNPSQWQVALLDAGQVKRLRANTWENLNFFAGLEKAGGRVELGGEESVDGMACVKLAFIHAEKIVFTRYFDKTSGRLVKTVTEDGGEIREVGESFVGGIRFPRQVINKSSDGRVTTITFASVVLNEPVSAERFAVPTLLGQ